MESGTQTNCPKTTRFYNLVLCLLGIHTKLLDFQCFNSKTKVKTNPLEESLLKLVSAIIFIAFLLQYPILVSIIVFHLPYKKTKRRVEFFVYYAHFYIKYLVIFAIYIFELFTEKRTIEYQDKIQCILLRVDELFTYWSQRSKKNHFKSTSLRETLIDLSFLTTGRLFRIVVIISCSLTFNCLKYSFAFKGCEYEHIYDFFFCSLPNIFISLFVLHFSSIIRQYSKLFRLLNKLMEMVASDIANQISESTKQYWPGKIITYRYNEPDSDKRQLHTAITDISTLIETHNELRENIATLRKYHAIQLNAIILNAFLNITFEVSIGSQFK